MKRFLSPVVLWPGLFVVALLPYLLQSQLDNLLILSIPFGFFLIVFVSPLLLIAIVYVLARRQHLRDLKRSFDE